MERWIAMRSKDPSVLNTVWQVIGTDLHGRKVGCNLFSWKFLPHNMCPPFMLIANLTRNKAYKLSTSCFAPFFLNSKAVIRWSLVVSGIQYPLVIFWSLTGKYCIYKKYPGCPEGLTSGELFWDDQDGYQINDDGGVLPEGRYNHDTTINFCCRTDGDRDDPVLLPVKSPFFSSGVWVGKVPDGQMGCFYCGVDTLWYRRLGQPRRSTWCVPLQRWKNSSHHFLLLLPRWGSIASQLKNDQQVLK